MAIVPPSTDPLALHLGLLGKAPDGDVAARAGIEVEVVRARRRELGIKGFIRPLSGRAASPAVPGSVVVRRRGTSVERVNPVVEHPLDRHRHLFATFNDEDVADLSGQTAEDVRAYRTSRRLPVAGVASEERPARNRRGSRLEAYTEQIGKVPDGEIARKAGVSRSWVVAFRKRHGIAAWEAPADATRAKVSAPEATPEAGPRRRRSKMDGVLHLIGVRSDAEVAALAGVTPDNVRNFRRRHGIAPTAAEKGPTDPITPPVAQAHVAPPPAAEPRPRGRPGRRSPIQAHEALLGTIPDDEIARIAGTTVGAVMQYRMRRRIAPHRPAVATTPPAPVVSPVAAPVVAPVVSPVAAPVVRAWRVLAARGTETRRFVVVAADLLEAVTIAARGLAALVDGPWHLERIREDGEGLR